MEKVLVQALSVLKKGGTILYPTDTIWGIGCDATDEQAVEKIYKIKQRSQSKALIVLVCDWAMLLKYIAQIPENKFKTQALSLNRPTTIIYPNAIGLAPNLIAEDGSIAIRIPQHDFCHQLIKTYGKPIVSTSANIAGEAAPTHDLQTVSPTIKERVDYVCSPLKTSERNIASRILKIDSITGEMIVIRE